MTRETRCAELVIGETEWRTLLAFSDSSVQLASTFDRSSLGLAGCEAVYHYGLGESEKKLRSRRCLEHPTQAGPGQDRRLSPSQGGLVG